MVQTATSQLSKLAEWRAPWHTSTRTGRGKAAMPFFRFFLAVRHTLSLASRPLSVAPTSSTSETNGSTISAFFLRVASILATSSHATSDFPPEVGLE